MVRGGYVRLAVGPENYAFGEFLGCCVYESISRRTLRFGDFLRHSWDWFERSWGELAVSGWWWNYFGIAREILRSDVDLERSVLHLFFRF